MWDCLPDEVLTEKILSRLPVKSIIQCRCVCKSWFSLITTPIFISNYLGNLNLNLKTQNTQLFLHQRDYYDKTSGSCALLFDNNEQDYLRPMLLGLLPDRNFHCDFIMVFDVKTETFHQISLPECLAYFQPHQPGLINARRIMEFGDSSIAAIEPAEYAAHVWVMKEYGSVESWIKLATLKLEFYYSPVLGFRNKDEVLILLNPISGVGPVRESECIISRNINNEEIKNLMNVEEHSACIFSRVYKYVPSLVLLDKQNNFDAPVVVVDVDVDVTPLVEDEEELRRSKCALAYGLCSEIGQLCH